MVEQRTERWLRQPIEVVLPTRLFVGGAKVLAVLIHLVMLVVGMVIALVSAHAAERSRTEGIGTMGVELGAALWFGGAVSLGIRRAPTVLRVLIIGLVGLCGAVVVASALLLDWTGAGLSLAMEFGVGAIAVAVIDVVILGVVHSRIESFAHTPADGSGRRLRFIVRRWTSV